jgi:hypothetical protein
MDVRFCEDRNHRREAQMRAEVLAMIVLARSSEARVRRLLFSLDKDLHGRRPTGQGSGRVVSFIPLSSPECSK